MDQVLAKVAASMLPYCKSGIVPGVRFGAMSESTTLPLLVTAPFTVMIGTEGLPRVPRLKFSPWVPVPEEPRVKVLLVRLVPAETIVTWLLALSPMTTLL